MGWETIQHNCHNDDRNQCAWQHKVGDRGDELPQRTISLCVCTWTYVHTGVCVSVNGSVLWLPIPFHFPCKSAQSAGVCVDSPACIVCSPDTQSLTIFHVNGVYQWLFFFHGIFCLFVVVFFSSFVHFYSSSQNHHQNLDSFSVFACLCYGSNISTVFSFGFLILKSLFLSFLSFIVCVTYLSLLELSYLPTAYYVLCQEMLSNDLDLLTFSSATPQANQGK